MHPRELVRMPTGDRGPALRQQAQFRLDELEHLEAEMAAKIERRRRGLDRLARLAKAHKITLPAAVLARLNRKP